jgi:hypothetical protein
MKLSMLVTFSQSLNAYFPYFFALHQQKSEEVYREMFTEFMRIFPPHTFRGITLDNDEAVIGAYLKVSQQMGLTLKQAEERLRLCAFHFLKSINKFGRATGSLETLLPLAQVLLEAAKHRKKSDPTSPAEVKFLNAERELLSTMERTNEKKFRSWSKFWLIQRQGIHWRCLLDIGEEDHRSTLHSTTNSSESSNRVIKFEHSILKTAPTVILHRVLDELQKIEKNYQNAQQGSSISRYRQPLRRRKIPESTLPLATLPQLAPAPSQGVPSIVDIAKIVLSRKATATPPPALALASSTVASNSVLAHHIPIPARLPLWKWNRNSCAFDAALLILFFSFLPKGIPSSSHLLSLQKTPSLIGDTPLDDTRPCSTIFSDIRSSWTTLSGEVALRFLTALRDQFRLRILALINNAPYHSGFSLGTFAPVSLIFKQAWNDLRPNSECIEITVYHNKVCQSSLCTGCSGTHSLQELLDRQRRQPSVLTDLICFEMQFYDAENRFYSPDLLAKFANLEISPSLSCGDHIFALVGCVDYDRVHYRAQLMVREKFRILDSHIPPGHYLADGENFAHQGPLPDSAMSLMQSLPAFQHQEQSTPRPFYFIYHRRN